MNKRCCNNCEYFERYFGKDDKFGICEIDMAEVVPQSDWCPSWEEKQNVSDDKL